MSAPVHNTFVIERTYPAAPARVFAAFADPAKKSRWYAESLNHEVERFEMDFRVGGVERSAYKMAATTPFPGVELANEGTYYDIVEGRRVVVGAAMSLGGARISVALVTFEFEATAAGTRLTCTHQAVFFENSGGWEMRERGWQTLFDRLGVEVAAEVASA